MSFVIGLLFLPETKDVDITARLNDKTARKQRHRLHNDAALRFGGALFIAVKLDLQRVPRCMQSTHGRYRAT